MSEGYIESLRATLDELEERRADLSSRLSRVSADIDDLKRIILRHEGGHIPRPRRFESSRGLPRGAAREEILRLLADGAIWTPARIAQARGTSSNAASAALHRLAAETPPAVFRVSEGQYRIAAPKGDADKSAPAATEADAQLTVEGGGR